MSNHMFVRLGTKENVDTALKMLAEFDPKIERDDMMTTVFAPDGDIVFQAIHKGDGAYICRYHDEVFAR